MKNKLKNLFAKTSSGIKPGLEVTENLLKNLGNPEKNYKTIHIAGTNGKGSVASFIEQTLKNNGLKTGLYTSPHLYDFRERIKVNQEMISKKQLEDIFEITQEYDNGLRPATFFEFTTAMAFKHFSNEKIDAAIVETGMGGRFDSTNTIKPHISVITNISLDHTDFLGSRIEDIAYEKAGIIKPSVPCVTACKNSEALKVIADTALEQNSPLYVIERDFTITKNKENFILQSSIGPDITLDPFLPGEHQITNSALAAFSCLLLNKYYPEEFNISKKNIEQAIKETRWKARLETVCTNPSIIIDCAHNPDSIQSLVSFLETKKSKFTFVFGALQDKDYKTNLSLIEPIAQKFIFTKPDSPRAMEPKELSKLTEIENIVINDPVEAYLYAKNNACNNDMICVTGSIYLIGMVMEFIDNNR